MTYALAFAPLTSSTLAPALRKMKVGIALMLYFCAMSLAESTST